MGIMNKKVHPLVVCLIAYVLYVLFIDLKTVGLFLFHTEFSEMFFIFFVLLSPKIYYF